MSVEFVFKRNGSSRPYVWATADPYDVFVVSEFGLELVGQVFKSQRTWERRTKGRRYVNARGQTPCWRAGELRSTFDTRQDAAMALLREIQTGRKP